MKTRFINKIGLDKKNIPYKWMENLVSNGKFGGVMLVFVEGFTQTEIDNKVKAIINFCKSIKRGGDIMDTFRKEYIPLDEQQKAEMLAIKEKAEELEVLFLKSIQREPRLMAMAKSLLELSIMCAVKAVTTEQKSGENPQS